MIRVASQMKSRRRTRIKTAISTDDLRGVPTARETGWFVCENCANLHLILKDEDGEPIAVAALDEDMLVDMLATLRGAVPQ